jgi:hypothetical protein
MIMSISDLDILGNEEDGYDVNDVIPTSIEFEIKDELVETFTDSDLKQMLINQRIIVDKYNNEDITVTYISDEPLIIDINYLGRPEFRLGEITND